MVLSSLWLEGDFDDHLMLSLLEVGVAENVSCQKLIQYAMHEGYQKTPVCL